MTPQGWLIERRFGKPGSDQLFAHWLNCALEKPLSHATPDEKQILEANYVKAIRIIRKAAQKNAEEFFLRWSRGNKALKAADPDYCRDPRYFLCNAYFRYAVTRLPTQKQLIWTAIRELAIVQLSGYPNALPMPGDEPSEEEIAAEIERTKLEGKPWRRYLKEIGLGGNVLPRAKAGNPHRKKEPLLSRRPSESGGKRITLKFSLDLSLYAMQHFPNKGALIIDS
jgi:hypothetical protein